MIPNDMITAKGTPTAINVIRYFLLFSRNAIRPVYPTLITSAIMPSVFNEEKNGSIVTAFLSFSRTILVLQYATIILQNENGDI